MVRITEDGFCIEIKTTQPAHDYVQLVTELVTVLQTTDPELTDDNFIYLHNLLKALLPTIQQAESILKEAS